MTKAEQGLGQAIKTIEADDRKRYCHKTVAMLSYSASIVTRICTRYRKEHTRVIPHTPTFVFSPLRFWKNDT